VCWCKEEETFSSWPDPGLVRRFTRFLNISSLVSARSSKITFSLSRCSLKTRREIRKGSGPEEKVIPGERLDRSLDQEKRLDRSLDQAKRLNGSLGKRLDKSLDQERG